MPKLVFMLSPAGSGKTTIGLEVAKMMPFVYLDKDTVTRQFTEALLSTSGFGVKGDRESAFYTNVIRPIEYRTMLNVAKENLSLGNNVLLSAPFLSEVTQPDYITRQIYNDLSPDAVQVLVVLVSTSLNLQKERLVSRGADRDLWKLSHWEEYVEAVKNFKVSWNGVSLFKFNNDDENGSDAFVAQLESLKSWLSDSVVLNDEQILG